MNGHALRALWAVQDAVLAFDVDERRAVGLLRVGQLGALPWNERNRLARLLVDAAEWREAGITRQEGATRWH